MHTLIHKIAHIHTERTIFWCLAALFTACFAMYGYFTVMSIIHVVLRQELSVSIQEAETEVSELEAQYLARSSQLSREEAERLGLVELQPVAYVSVLPDGGRLTRRE